MDKMRIVVCDADKKELEIYANICLKICESSGVASEIKLCSSIHELKFDMEDDAFIALVNIFIIEPGNGFETAPDEIRKAGYDGLIIYLSHSTMPQDYHHAFDMKAFNYLQKGADMKDLSRFREVFKESLQAAKDLERQYIVLNYAGEYKQILIKEIYYFESLPKHMIRVVYEKKDFVFPSTLKDIEESLRGHGFARCHTSFIVSIDTVQRLSYSEVTLNNGQTIPVGRNYLKNFKAAMERWRL